MYILRGGRGFPTFFVRILVCRSLYCTRCARCRLWWGWRGGGSRGEVDWNLKTIFINWSCCTDGSKGKEVMMSSACRVVFITGEF